jgi:hypothetical protein
MKKLVGTEKTSCRAQSDKSLYPNRLQKYVKQQADWLRHGKNTKKIKKQKKIKKNFFIAQFIKKNVIFAASISECTDMA